MPETKTKEGKVMKNCPTKSVINFWENYITLIKIHKGIGEEITPFNTILNTSK